MINLISAVKKGRYTLEKRAETIKDSRRYWNPGSTNPEVKPSTSRDETPSCVDAENSVTYPNNSSPQSDTADSNSSSSSDVTIRSLLKSPPASVASMGSPFPAFSDIDWNMCGGNDIEDAMTSGGECCQPHLDFLLRPKNQDYNVDMGENLNLRKETRMEDTSPMSQSLLSLLDDVMSTSSGSTCEEMGGNVPTIHKFVQNKQSKTGLKLIDAIDNLSKSLQEHRTFLKNTERPSASRILSGLYDQDEGVEQFMTKIDCPPSDLDEAIANNCEDNDRLMDRIIRQTVDAYAQQNIMNRGFMAKIPDFQHRFLVNILFK